jgi:hypothetical protein
MKSTYALLFFAITLISCSANAKNNPSSNPQTEQTYAVIVGALQWTDQYLPPFEKKNRKDQELYELLKTTGVDDQNIVFLMDEQATLKNIKENMKTILGKTTPGSHFIFYYAGHGMHQNGKYYFANYDIVTTNPSETGLDLDIISNLITNHFKGSRVSLWADCCYSGGLAGTAETLSKKGFKACALTSATATNTSTGNWTYSQTLIDCLRGSAIMDKNNDGSVSLNEMAGEVKDAMKYRERQLNTFSSYGLDGDKTIISYVSGKMNKSDAEIGSYVFALHGGKWEVARVTGKTNGEYDCEFYFYSDKESKTLPATQVRKPHFVEYKTGIDVKIEYHKKWYDATIVKSDGDFYYVTYKGYDNSYDEWVLYDRIRTGNEKKAQVLWEGQYYSADVLESNGNKSYVHYDGYDYTWDEWTDSKNIQ